MFTDYNLNEILPSIKSTFVKLMSTNEKFVSFWKVTVYIWNIFCFWQYSTSTALKYLIVDVSLKPPKIIFLFSKLLIVRTYDVFATWIPQKFHRHIKYVGSECSWGNHLRRQKFCNYRLNTLWRYTYDIPIQKIATYSSNDILSMPAYVIVKWNSLLGSITAAFHIADCLCSLHIMTLIFYSFGRGLGVRHQAMVLQYEKMSISFLILTHQKWRSFEPHFYLYCTIYCCLLCRTFRSRY